MSARIFIAPGIQAIPQADFAAMQADDNGSWTATQSFQIVKGSVDDPLVRDFFGRDKSITQFDPNAAQLWAFLRSRKASFLTIPGGWDIVQVEFGGFPNLDDQGNPVNPGESFVTYAMRGQIADTPLPDHHKWKALDLSERIALGKLMSGEYGWGPEYNGTGNVTYFFDNGEQSVFLDDPIVSADAIQFAQRITEGRTSFRGAGFTWTKRWSALSPIPSAQLNALGKITNNPPGSPPTPSGNRDWLLVAANIEQSGEIDANPTFTNELVFELSEQGGHDEFLQS